MPRRLIITLAPLLLALLIGALARTAVAGPVPSPTATAAQSARDACSLSGLVPAHGSDCPAGSRSRLGAAGGRLRDQWLGIPVLPDPVPVVKKVVGGAASTAIKAVALVAILGWVASGAESALKETAKVIDDTTSPQLTSSWFSASYWRVAGIAALLTLPFLCAAAVHALVRSDLGLLTRAAFGYLPLSLLAVGIASQLTMLLLAGTDEMSSIVASASLHADSVFLSTTSVRAVAESVATGDPFVTFLAAIITVAATLTLWLELLVRNAAVYVIVLMLPLFFAAMVWPARRTLAIRAIETLIALILSKFAIVAVLSLGGSALGHSTVPGAAAVLTGGTLVLLAAFTPWALLRILPLHEVASAAAGGLSHAPRQTFSSAADRALRLGEGVAALGGEHLARRALPDGQSSILGGVRSARGSGTDAGPELGAERRWTDPLESVDAIDAVDAEVAEPVTTAMSATAGAAEQFGPESATSPTAAAAVTPGPDLTGGATGGESARSATAQPGTSAGSTPHWPEVLSFPNGADGGGASPLWLGDDLRELADQRRLPAAGAVNDGDDPASTQVAGPIPPTTVQPSLAPARDPIGSRPADAQRSERRSEVDEPPTPRVSAPELGLDPLDGGDA